MNGYIIGRRSAISSKNRGGTEEIAKFFKKKTGFQVIYDEQWIKSLFIINSKVIFISPNKMTYLVVMALSPLARNKVYYVQTANRRTIFNSINRLLMKKVFKNNVYCLSQSCIQYYSSRATLLSLYDVATIDQHKNNGLSKSDRLYDIAYIGRIDKEKGYYIAKDILLSDKLKFYSRMFDILLWGGEDEDKEVTALSDASRGDSNVTFFYGGKDKLAPDLYDVNVLVLPYESLDSTIAVPLLIVEALVYGCNVVLPITLINDVQLHTGIDASFAERLFFYSENDRIYGKVMEALNEQK